MWRASTPTGSVTSFGVVSLGVASLDPALLACKPDGVWGEGSAGVPPAFR